MEQKLILLGLISSLLPFTVSDSLVYLGCYLTDFPRPSLTNTTNVSETGSDTNETKVDPHEANKILEVIDDDFNGNSGIDLWFRPSEANTTKNPQDCILVCRKSSFRYAGLYFTKGYLNCVCGSSYGRLGIGQCALCTKTQSILSEHEHCGSQNSTSIYDTGFKVPSQPRQVILQHRGENTLRISWLRPLATNGPLSGYLIFANGLFSHSRNSQALQPKTWRANELDQELVMTGLIPGTKYNVSIVAINSEGPSLSTNVILWSKIGVPDIPPAPRVIGQDSKTMTIKFSPVQNTKGPLTKYRIVMVDESRFGFFSKNRVATWNETVSIDYPQYITAEFFPNEFPTNGRFIIGNGGYYHGFYNGPIPEGHWHPSLGILSTLDGVTEISYSATSHDQHESTDTDFQDYSMNPTVKPIIFGGDRPKKKELGPVEIVNENSILVTSLWISIGITGIILLICISIFLILKLDMFPKRNRRRLPFSPTTSTPLHQIDQPTELMTCRSPAYIFPDELTGGGYTHSGFINDEDFKNRALDKLKEIWYVPRNFITVPSDEEDSVHLIGKGRYGPVYSSLLKSNNESGTSVTLYTIPGIFLKSGNRKNGTWEDTETFFRELDELVKIDAHENVLKLVGFIEESDSLHFVIEFGGVSLKQWLLDYRDLGHTEEVSKKPSEVAYTFLICAMNIAEAMFHLSSFKITHGELAACNIQVTTLEVPKLTGFGILKNDSPNEEKDYTRWFAVEQFQNRCVKSCDAWSFGILLWELATLGGTPYYDIRSEDLQKRICRGSRPSQIEVIGDPLYQIMLHCWQLDRDERPDFGSLSCSIHELLPYSKDSLFISSSFNYPPYLHQLEHIK